MATSADGQEWCQGCKSSLWGKAVSGDGLHGLDRLSVGEGGCSPSQSRELTCENPSRCHSVEWGRSGAGGRGHWSHHQACDDAFGGPCAPSCSFLACSFILEYRSGHTCKCSERSLMALPLTHVPEWAQVAKVPRSSRGLVWSRRQAGAHPAGGGRPPPSLTHIAKGDLECGQDLAMRQVASYIL